MPATQTILSDYYPDYCLILLDVRARPNQTAFRLFVDVTVWRAVTFAIDNLESIALIALQHPAWCPPAPNWRLHRPIQMSQNAPYLQALSNSPLNSPLNLKKKISTSATSLKVALPSASTVLAHRLLKRIAFIPLINFHWKALSAHQKKVWPYLRPYGDRILSNCQTHGISPEINLLHNVIDLGLLMEKPKLDHFFGLSLIFRLSHFFDSSHWPKNFF